MPPAGRGKAVGLDAGGSSTRMSWMEAGERVDVQLPSINPASVGRQAAESSFRLCIREAVRVAGSEAVQLCVAAAFMPIAVGQSQPSYFGDLVREELNYGSVLMVNDVVPLLYAPPLSADGIVVSSGTGSAVVGRGPNGVVVVGGHEYLLSDGGSAFWIGLKGLRTAARQWDDQDHNAVLCAAARQHFKTDLPNLGRRLAHASSAKIEVAAFAAVVSSCARDGDPGSVQIVEWAADSLARDIAVCERRAALGSGARLLFAGSVMRKCHGLQPKLLDRLGASTTTRAVMVGDNLDAAVWLAESLDARKGTVDLLRSEVSATIYSAVPRV